MREIKPRLSTRKRQGLRICDFLALSDSLIRLVSFLRKTTHFSREASSGTPSPPVPVIRLELGEEFLAHDYVRQELDGRCRSRLLHP